jgi:hypothetical protein
MQTPMDRHAQRQTATETDTHERTREEGKLPLKLRQHLIFQLCDPVEVVAPLQLLDAALGLLQAPPHLVRPLEPLSLLEVPGAEGLELGVDLGHLCLDARSPLL